MANRVSKEDWANLVEHLRVQMSDGRACPNYVQAQKATGIDRRTVKAHWETGVHDFPAIQRFFKREGGVMTLTPTPAQAPASRKPVAVPTATPISPALTITPAPTALTSGSSASPSQAPAPTATVSLDSFEQIKAAALASLKDEQQIVEGQHALSQGLIVITNTLLVALHQALPDVCEKIKVRFSENPKESVAVLRELMEISEKLSKTHGRTVETQRTIAGIPSHSSELVVRREGGQDRDPDAEDRDREQTRLLTSLIKAAARRQARASGDYDGEGGGFIEVEVTPVQPPPAPALPPADSTAEPG